MSATFKLYFLLVGLCVILCLLGYELYQGYGVVQNAKNNHKQDYEVAKKDLALLFRFKQSRIHFCSYAY